MNYFKENSFKLTNPDFFQKGLAASSITQVADKYSAEEGSSAYYDIQEGIRCAEIVSNKDYS